MNLSPEPTSPDMSVSPGTTEANMTDQMHSLDFNTESLVPRTGIRGLGHFHIPPGIESGPTNIEWDDEAVSVGDEDARLDHQKASTIAAVTSKRLDTPETSSWMKVEEGQEPKFVSSVGDLLLQHDLEEHDERVKVLWSHINQAREKGKTKHENRLVETLKKESENFAGSVDGSVYVFERLYDLNPELFADMPTKDFFDKVHELFAIDTKLWNAEDVTNGLHRMTNDPEWLNKMEAGEFGSPSDEFLDSINRALRVVLAAEDMQVLDEMFENTLDPWKRSGEERARALRSFLGEAVNRCAKPLDAARRERHEFLSQFMPHQSAEEAQA